MASKFQNIFRRKTTYSSINANHPWTPGLVGLPVLGTAALLLAAVGVIFSAIVLAVSDGKTLQHWSNDWTFSPTVYLSIASTITNITLQYALYEGLDVTWWKSALGAQTTIADLHRTWSYGNSFIEALTSFRHLNYMAIVCIIVTVSPINGPLLQRASRVVTRSASVTQNLDLSIAHQLPLNYSGYVIGRAHYPGLLTQDFSKVVLDYYRQRPISMKTKCRNTCRGKVLAAGWALYCQSYKTPYNMTISEANLNVNQEIFQSGYAWEADEPTTFNIGTQIKEQTGCLGDLLVTNCTLNPATVEYQVELTSSSISLAPGTTIWNDTIIGKIPVLSTEIDIEGSGPTTYGGFYLALMNRFGSFLLSSYGGPPGYQQQSSGEMATAYVTSDTSQPNCDITFSNPMDDILEGTRELMFRAAVDAGSRNSSDRQTVLVTDTGPQNYYDSQYVFLGLATMLSAVGIICVTVTFNGFWKLGRHVTLSPIETAKAFNAPLLKSRDSNAPIHSLLHEIGDRPVRYGAVPVGTGLNHRTVSPRPPSLPDVPRSQSFDFANEIPYDVTQQHTPPSVSMNGHPLSQTTHADETIPEHDVEEAHAEKEGDGTTRFRLELAPPNMTGRPEAGVQYVGY